MNTTFLLLLLTASISSYPPAESSASLYHKSYISSQRLGGWMKFIKQVLSPDTNMKQVLYRCDVVVKSCKSVCKLSNGSWALIEQLIPADIADNRVGTKLLCLTFETPLIFPSTRKLRSISGISYLNYHVENLLGYYTGGSKSDVCFRSEISDPYFLIEFNIAQMVTKIIFLSNHLELWLGNLKTLK